VSLTGVGEQELGLIPHQLGAHHMLDHPTDAFFVLRHLQRLVQLRAEALPPAVDRLCHLHFFQQVALLAQVSVERPEHEHGERNERKCRAHREDVVRGCEAIERRQHR